MSIRKHHLHSILIGASLLALAACSGMSPSGGGAAGGDFGGPVGGGGLDVGGGGPLGGANPPGAGGGDDAGGGPGTGQGQPSTQQSGDNIGGGCARFYSFKVKILHNGAEEACTIATAVTFRVNSDVVIGGGTGTMYDPPTEPDGNPKVILNIGYPITQTLACISGQWQTAEPIFVRAVCSNYNVSAYSTWQRQGKSHMSNTFQGAPVPNENNDPIPIELTIDLGQDAQVYQVPLDNAENAVY